MVDARACYWISWTSHNNWVEFKESRAFLEDPSTTQCMPNITENLKIKKKKRGARELIGAKARCDFKSWRLPFSKEDLSNK